MGIVIGKEKEAAGNAPAAVKAPEEVQSEVRGGVDAEDAAVPAEDVKEAGPVKAGAVPAVKAAPKKAARKSKKGK